MTFLMFAVCVCVVGGVTFLMFAVCVCVGGVTFLMFAVCVCVGGGDLSDVCCVCGGG